MGGFCHACLYDILRYRRCDKPDYKLNSELLEKTKAYGTDGKLIADKDGNPYLVSITAKMLQILIAKIANLVPGGGIWLNTQRPEWNDANNALAGYGLSVVTTCYLQRFLKELILIYESANQKAFTMPVEIASCFTNLGKVFAKYDAEKTAKDAGLMSETMKNAAIIMMCLKRTAMPMRAFTTGISAREWLCTMINPHCRALPSGR